MGIRLKGQTSGYVEIKAPATSADNTLTLPNGNGSSNQVLTTDGSGGLTFAAPQLSTDTTPQLGGDLDVNGNDIVTTSNGDIDLDPNGSGQVVFKGNSTRGSGQIKLNCEQNSHGITVKGPPHSSGANYTLTLPNDTGTSGQLLTTNGSGVTSWSTVSASASFEATASGAIANGDPCVILSDGKVAAVSEAFTSNTEGSEAQFASMSSSTTARQLFRDGSDIAYNPVTDRVVAVYRDPDDSQKGKAVIGSISGTTLSWGNTTIFDTNDSRFTTIVYDEKNEVLVVLYNTSSGGQAFVLTSDASDNITVGTKLNFHTGNCQDLSAIYDSSAGKIVAVYRDNDDANKCKANVLTVNPSNNTLTVGTAVEISGIRPNAQVALGYDPEQQKILLAMTDALDSNLCNAVVGQVTGTGMQWGSKVNVQSTSEANSIRMTYDESIKRMVIFYNHQTDSSPLAVTGMIDGLSVTFGATTEIDTNECGDAEVVYNPHLGKCTFVYRDNDSTNDPMTVRHGKVRSDGISLDGKITAVNDDCVSFNACYASKHDAVVVIFNRQDSTNRGKGIVLKGAGNVTNLEAGNYIGIADAAYSDAATATIQIASAVDDAQSGLRIGQKYFVQRDGSLAVTPDFPEVFAGTAVSATKLIVKG